jgi:hypothetical protein
MGRYSLLTLASFSVFACAVERPPPDPAGNGHAGLACAACHQGGIADRELASVPPETCQGSDCHALDIPGEVVLSSVRFTHQGHGSTETLAVGCAGCHHHGSGEEPITAGPETCGLCHVEELAGARGEDCRLCHAAPDHQGMTSQGLPVPHQGLPWIEGGCLRCHYAVARPVHEVSVARCAQCHEDATAATQAGIGEDLHPTHTSVGCGSCHEADNHRIEAMSSAVELECITCHHVEHDVEVGAVAMDSDACNECHRGVHVDEQRLLLGILPETPSAAPSDHFMDGLTCRSCHWEGDATTDHRTRGSSEACVACHRPEYAIVFRWWTQGIEERTRLVERYVAGAESAVAGRAEADQAVKSFARARQLLTVIRTAGGQHNLPLTHRIFEDALAASADAYRLSGRGVPTPPQLGRAPRQGLCAYCHYRLREPGLTEGMDDAFHREVMGRR